MKCCAVIPAAGRGTRLNADRPKILVEVAPQFTIWKILFQNLQTIVDHIHVILSADGLPIFQNTLSEANRFQRTMVSTSVQPKPLGMGDAIFQSREYWKHAENILIIWGDQVHVSQNTLSHCLRVHNSTTGNHCTMPVVSLEKPYVEYLFHENGKLIKVLQSREGDQCHSGGWGDTGAFLLSTHELSHTWQKYLSTHPRGEATGEINFLPFLVFLSQSENWDFHRIQVTNPDEARGINTQADLAFFQKIYKEGLKNLMEHIHE